jgi:uncharacterized protein YjbI with pentapeptide repeats
MGKLSDTQRRNIFWLAIIFATVACFSVAIVAIFQFGWDWTGLTSYTTKKTDAKGNITEIETHPGKTLWDGLDLVIIPVALGLGAFFLNKAQSQNEQLIASKQRQNEQLIASNEQQELLLQSYIDAMTALILDKDLCGTSDQNVRNLARSRTLTVLRALDTPNPDGNNRRRASLIRFLYEMKLIVGENPVISLKKANFEVAYMRTHDLRGANLQEVDFYRADLRDADLTGANLEGAYLVEAKLQGANFDGANLSKATLKNACYGKYVSTETKWPEGFIPGAELIEQDIEKSGDWSKNIK